MGHLITSVITEYAEGDDLYNNAWIREYKERYNIEFDIVFAEKSENYATKVNLAMAEKNLPDVFYVTAAQLDQLVEADLLYDLTDVFEVYATDSIKAIAAADETTFETAKRDGRLYAMPQFDSGFLPQFKMMWIRKDWMEGLGLEAPETMDDLVAIAETFMEEYGASYGIATNKSLYPDVDVLLATMNAQSGRSAQLFLASVPVLVAYPFLQKYFTSGLTIGSVKG